METVSNKPADFWLTNLEKLRDFLIQNASEIEFSMGAFFDKELMTSETLETKPSECGAVACAVGWAPFVVPPDPNNSKLWYNGVLNYVDYSNKYLLQVATNAWDYMFSGDWEYVDNTAIGAAYRIDAFVQHVRNVMKLESREEIYERLFSNNREDWTPEGTRFESCDYHSERDTEKYNAAKEKWLEERRIMQW